MNIQKIQKLKKEACKIECIVFIKRIHNYFQFWALNRKLKLITKIVGFLIKEWILFSGKTTVVLLIKCDKVNNHFGNEIYQYQLIDYTYNNPYFSFTLIITF